MRLRNISRIIVIALVALVGAVALIHQRVAGEPSPTSAPALTGGTALHDATPAFTLHDQTGAVVTPASLRGHPVILTFMDMTCTEECPIIAQELQLTANFIGQEKAARVEWVVISVNPNNTPAQAAAFLKKQNVTIPVKVLLGTQSELSPAWAKFGIFVQPSQTDVVHTAATFLIDQSGNERMVFLDSVDSKALAADLSTLLASK
jgi:cytochrome oxidase Cu insertion factor (SCO1/SenC/PrrC family)